MVRWSASHQANPQSPISTIAVVVEAIAPHQTGLVKFQGRWHVANCDLSMTLQPNALVKVVGDFGDCLTVIPITEHKDF